MASACRRACQPARKPSMNARQLMLAAAIGALSLGGCGKSAAPATDASAPDAKTAPAAPAAAPAAADAAPAPAAAAPAAPAAIMPAGDAPAANPHAAVAAGPHGGAPALPTGSAGKPDRIVINGFMAMLPPSWIPTQPSNPMRIAQFEVPPARGADPGEAVVFFFPPGQGGTQEANIERWASQFSAPDKLPVLPKTTKSKAGNSEVTLVELQGNYSRGVGMGQESEARPDQTLLVSMIETPAGRITIQLYGPSKTVAAQRDSFLKLARGFRPL